MTVSEPLLEVQNISKTFITGLPDSPYTRSRVTALADISFNVYRGESVGIVGPNGSGKSTLLRAVGGTTSLDRGRIIRHVHPRMIMSLGGSFSQQLTGRENIYLYGAMLGLLKREINELIPAIIDFSELKKVIDEPLKTYSRGMQTRLSFSIVSQGRPELICLDEVLGAGDEYFQNKSAARIRELTKLGTTFLVTSHNLPKLKEFVSRIIEIDNGHLISDRPVKQLP